MKNTKLFSVLLIAMAMALVAVMPLATATTDLDVGYLKINGEELDLAASGMTLEVTRGETMDLRVRVSAINNDVENVQISAGLYGYQYSQYEPSKIYDVSNTFDLDLGDTRNVDLGLKIPVRMDDEDMTLRIVVADRTGVTQVYEYNLDVQGTDRSGAILIKEAYLSPSNTVMAGRALSSLVKIENIGQRDLDDITLIVSVPELGIRDTETLDQLDANEVETFEKIILRFPKDVVAGDYRVDYTVKFDEFETVTASDVVTVTPCSSVACGAAKPSTEGQTVVQVPNSQAVTAGASEAVYPLMINNLGDSAKMYTVQLSGVDAWGTVRVDPGASVVVPAQSTATVFIYVSANSETEAGEKYFKATVGTPDGDMKEIPLSVQVSSKANEENTNYSSLQRTLEVALIILIVILILIGLIVGFNKLRGNNDGDDAKTYY